MRGNWHQKNGCSTAGESCYVIDKSGYIVWNEDNVIGAVHFNSAMLRLPRVVSAYLGYRLSPYVSSQRQSPVRPPAVVSSSWTGSPPISPSR